MIELVRFGTLKLELSSILSKDIKMQFMPWLLMSLSGIYSFKSSRDKIITGCFDTTAKLWETETGKLLHTFAGHQN